MTTIIDIFKAYDGTGYYCIIFVASLFYLWFSEEDKNLKCILVIVPIIIQILFFVPYFYMAYNALDEGTYYRILWLLPMTLVTAYAGCRIVGKYTKVGLAVISIILMISGTCVYLNSNVSRAENLYHIPQECVEICDMIMPSEGSERIWAAFPIDYVHYVRQYTTSIQLPFGRDSIVESWKKYDNSLYNMYAGSAMNADELSKCATDYYCNYVILEKVREVNGSLADAGLTLYGETDNYLIYVNENVPLFSDDSVTYVMPGVEE